MIELLRRTKPSQAVIEVLAREASARHYGYDLMKKAGLTSGTLYPILTRFERLGIIVSTWEEIDPAKEKRPARRVYTLTEAGLDFARSEMEMAVQVGALRHA